MDRTAALDSSPRRKRRRRDHRRMSEMLRALINAHPEPKISVWQLRDALSDRAYGVLLFVFTCPNLVPLPPGFATVLSIPIIVIAAQFVVGIQHPYFPAWLGRRALARTDLLTALGRIRQPLRWVERLLRPRLLWATSQPAQRLIGAACLIFAIVMALPIPFGHQLPALAICLCALAVLERDGAALCVGLTIGIGCIALYWTLVEKLVVATYHTLMRFIGT